jgi:hypothetical protein
MSKKKVFKGWVPNDENPLHFLMWNSKSTLLLGNPDIWFMKSKPLKGVLTLGGLHPEEWPPKRVTITIEIHDE